MSAPLPSPTTPSPSAERTAAVLAALRSGVTPATGCTEPVSLAFAAAAAARRLHGPVTRIDARVSPNLMKNGMGVAVPGTGDSGLVIAAAVGAVGGDPDKGLQILEGVDPAAIDAARALIADGRVHVGIEPVPDALWAEAEVTTATGRAAVRVQGGHTCITRIEVDGETVLEAADRTDQSDPHQEVLRSLTLREVHEIVTAADLADLRFIEEAAVLNIRLSDEGMQREYGLGLGRTLGTTESSPWWEQVEAMTAAASDARMGGAPIPAMTNAGSGNQGICATVPVTVVARHVGADDDQLIRALALSHLTALYIHAFLPPLSAFCAAATAGMGSAAGMVRLLGGDAAAAARAISSMAGDIVGMVCDGAAPSCTMKVASSSVSAARAVRMALEGRRVTGDEGLVSDDVDETIRNLGRLTCCGMTRTDTEILAIMMSKNRDRAVSAC